MNFNLRAEGRWPAKTILRRDGFEPLPVAAEFRICGNQLTVAIRCNGESEAGHQRHRLAVERLCGLDAAIERILRTGRPVLRKTKLSGRSKDEPTQAIDQIVPLLLPLHVHDNLFPYQRKGVSWLLRRARGILGDDMGLGKTAQALAGVRRLVRSGRVAWVLVVAPKTLIANWVSESFRWAPELTVAAVVPSGAEREHAWTRAVGRTHIVVTSYEQLRAPPQALIRELPDLVIADEAHRLRKESSLTTRGMRTLWPPRMWALTGTPVERDAKDVAVLLSLLDPARFSPSDRSLPITSLRARLRPYLLRRKKNDVLSDLPGVIERNEVLDLSESQKRAYQSAESDSLSGTQQNSNPLLQFNRLRILCDLDPSTGESSKLDRIVELIDDSHRSNEKTVVFSYVLDPLRQIERRLKQMHAHLEWATITGSMTLEQRAQSLNEFRSNPKCNVLLASSRIASEGLTLTEANHVIFVNRWWNPSSNTQARDRVVRIGQSKTVTVTTFTCRGTVEERLENLLAEKSLTFDDLIEALNQPGRAGEMMMEIVGDGPSL